MIVDEVRDPIRIRDEDGTEKLVDEGSTDKRLLVFEAEFGHVIAVASREGQRSRGATSDWLGWQ